MALALIGPRSQDSAGAGDDVVKVRAAAVDDEGRPLRPGDTAAGGDDLLADVGGRVRRRSS